jgi:hypothetical protein
MRAKVSRRLVIDASVARSAGGAGATFPASKHCRDFLLQMRLRSHRVVFTEPVYAEWKKHESTFARTWRASMVARKMLVRSQVPEDPVLRDELKEAGETERGRSAMTKDAHLIEAALAMDRTVVSLDDAVRALFGAATKCVAVLRDVIWANPAKPAENCLKWLDDGARPDAHRRLSAWRTRQG